MKYEPRSSKITDGRARRRGSALLLVVVLVVLLALMGIGFLFSMRAARLQASGAGTAALPQGTWPAVTESDYSNAIDNVVTDVNQKITQAVLTAGPPAAYLAPTNVESKYTAPKDSLYLADRFPLPEFDYGTPSHVAANLPLIRWGFISAFQTGAVRDTTSTAAPYANQDVYITQWLSTYPPAGSWPMMADGKTPYPGWVQDALSARARVFPAFAPTASKANLLATPWANSYKFLAADADGDGIADSVLVRVTGAGTSGSLVGTSGKVDFYRAVRVIDNSAAVNVNTAWRSTADRYYDTVSSSWKDVAPTDELYGYLGAFRSNIGLRELIAGEAFGSAAAQTTAILGSANAESDMGRVEAFRLNNSSATQTLQNIYAGADTATTGTIVPGYQYLTMGDSIEHGLSRRYQSPRLSVKTGFYSPNDRFKAFQERTHDQLAYHFFFGNRDFSAGDLLTQMPLTARGYVPNTWNGTVLPQSLFFGANQADFWNYTNLSTDDTGTESRSTFFTTNNSENYPSHPALTLTNVLKTARPHLVGENGVTVSRPVADVPTLVGTSQDPGTWGTTMADFADTPRKVWANGAQFGELWRAYYDLFKSATAAPVQLTNFNKGNNAAGEGLPTGTGVWDTNRQLLLRAGIAAINTIQARMGPTANVQVRTITIDGTSIKVFGAKPQPFISEVMFETGRRDPTAAYDATNNPIEVKWVAIEIHNPYNFSVKLSNQSLFLVNAGVTWTSGYVFPASEPDLLAGAHRVIVAKRAGYIDTGSPVAGLTAIGNPGNDAIIGSFPLSSTAGGSLRMMASDAGTAATTNGYDMIPQDEVDLQLGTNLVAGEPQRFRYSRPTLTTVGGRFNCVYNATPAAFEHIEDTAATAPATWNGVLNGTLVAPNENPSDGSSKQEMAIQVGNYSAFVPASVTKTAFPFQGFARDGDLLHVAYIGNYSYTTNAASPYVCSVGRDAFYAEDGNAGDDAYEAVGRFVPLSAANFAAVAPDAYDWTARLFDFVTAIQHPGSEWTPDVATGSEQLTYQGRSIQGKININTAGWETLAALPLIPVNPNVPAINTPDLAHIETVKLAKAIVAYRVANGPFQSIFDLNKVPEFAWRTAGVADANELLTTDLNIACIVGTHGYGDISPVDNAIGDFEQRLDGMTRISNLITTRSDSFTVYVLVQAWLAGTNPTIPGILVGERRAMYIMDRTGLTKTNTTFTEYPLVEKP